MITPKEFKTLMEECFDDSDTEAAHANADAIMCDILRELGFNEGVEIFENAKKWYA